MASEQRIAGVERRLEYAQVLIEQLQQAIAALQQGAVQAWQYTGGIGTLQPTTGTLTLTIYIVGCAYGALNDVPITAVELDTTTTPDGTNTAEFSYSYAYSAEDQTIECNFSADPTGVWARFQLTALTVPVTIPGGSTEVSQSVTLGLRAQSGCHCSPYCVQPLLADLFGSDAAYGPFPLAWTVDSFSGPNGDWGGCEEVTYDYPPGMVTGSIEDPVPLTSASIAIDHRVPSAGSATALEVHYDGIYASGLGYFPAPGTSCPISSSAPVFDTVVALLSVEAPEDPTMEPDAGFAISFAGTTLYVPGGIETDQLYAGFEHSSPLITVKEVDDF